MVQYIPPPDTRSLLAPLLACLPAAFTSTRPPPALLPLLSPILRQRVQLLSATAISPTDSWLPLLCWNPSHAEELSGIVESGTFELHPTSGEVEFQVTDDVNYRRLDEETLQAKVGVRDLQLTAIYLWCEGEQDGGGPSWLVSEVIPYTDRSENGVEAWWNTISEADERSKEALMAEALQLGAASGCEDSTTEADRRDENGSDDDDDYWAQYDNTPARTPAMKRSPAPQVHSGRARTTSEADYFAQYAHVQPALDNDDPSEDREAIGQSSLNGEVVADAMKSMSPKKDSAASSSLTTNGVQGGSSHLDQPRPSSSPTVTGALRRLENSATSQSHAEISIRQHISTSMKSLYRLARGSGIEREEFETIVQTELATLAMMTENN